MQELIAQAQTISRGMWKYRWPALAVAWLVGVVGAVAAFRVPERYEASARVYVDTQSILKPLMSGIAVQPNVDQQLAMLSRTLISRPNVEKLVRMADMDLRDGSRQQQEERIDALMKSLQVQSLGRDNLYTLAYRDSDPEQAKRVVQSLVSIFVESSLGASRKDTDTAKVFINEQIRAYQTKLEEAEARLKEFRLRNIELQSSDGRDTATRVADLAAQLDAAKLELREAEKAREAAKAALDAEKAQTGTLSTHSLVKETAIAVATPEVDARIEAQKRSIDLLLQRFTDEHPEVRAARRIVRDLEEQKRKEVAELRRAALAAETAPATGASAQSPAVLELSRMIATADVQVAALRARVGEYQARYDQARGRLKDAPRIEAEAAQLNRDYAVHRKAYDDLVARRESATMSGNLENVSGVAEFRLVDPPRVSPRPVAPNRILLLAAAMAAGIGAGLAAAFAASQLRPVFHRATDLRARFQLPLLGVVSLELSDRERRRERWDIVRFSAASAGLVAAFAVGMAVTVSVRGL